MAREFKEVAHLKTNKKQYDENFETIDWGSFKDKVITNKGKSKHKTAGLCGEYGMSTFDEKAFKENFEKICKCSIDTNLCEVHKVSEEEHES